MKEEKELLEILRETFPSISVNYGELQSAVVPAKFSSNNPMTKEKRDFLMNDLVDKLIEAKEYVGNPKTLNEAAYLLTILRIEQEKDWSLSLGTELGDREKDRGIEIPKFKIMTADSNYTVKLGFDYRKDTLNVDDENDIVTFNIKNIKIEKDGEEVKLNNLEDNFVKRFLDTLNEGSIGNTVSYQKGNKTVRDQVLTEELMMKFKDIARAFFLDIETIHQFKIDSLKGGGAEKNKSVSEKPESRQMKIGF